MNINDIIKVVEEITENSDIIKGVSIISPKAGTVMKTIPLVMALLKAGHISSGDAATSIRSMILTQSRLTSPETESASNNEGEQEQRAQHSTF